MQLSFDYEELNASYKMREISLSTDCFHSYSNQELEATSSSSENQIYVHSSTLEKRITELESKLATSRKLFDNERDQFLKKVKDLKQQLSNKTP